MTYHRYDPIIYDGRTAVYLWPMWQRYARIRFTDTRHERRTVAVMDIRPADEVGEVCRRLRK